MTPRVEAWLRQAHSDLEVARLTAAQGYHPQACDQAAEKALKALLVASRYQTSLQPFSASAF